MDFFYPPDLPITAYAPAIFELVEKNQVTIIAGDTGSGKTTQLPKICLELLKGSTKLIGCTQPRRIAATSVCERVREELGNQAHLVGSKIRFSDRTSADTRIKFMTDGVLLAETRNDPLLSAYDMVIVDEAHERSLNIDFLIGYLHRLLTKRTDLKLIITSATIDTDLFSKHFKSAPILQIEGRNYPVDVIYSAPNEDQDEISYLDHCIEMIDSVCHHYPPGDILVFLPTERDIRSCCEVIRGRFPDRKVLPLFGRLQAKDQQQIFKTHAQSKIVLASNVAETSVTVPGIRYVIDTGLARIAGYDHRSRTTRLPVTRISQASCNQRTGRCGRIGPGTCFRLYNEDDLLSRQEFTTPEIQRSNLAEVILQMIALNLGDPADFPFLEPPKSSAVRDGFMSLRELAAIDDRNRLTGTGRMMAGLPIDPVISRIIIEARKNDCLREIIIIASALAIQDPRVRPADKEQLADKAHKLFAHPQSDFISLLNIWNGYHNQVLNLSWGSLKRFCSEHFLSFQRMREWIDLHDQLKRILKSHKSFIWNTSDASYENIHRSLLSGLFRHSARRKQGALYQGTANNELMVFPGSQQYKRSGDWIMAGSFLETTRLYGLTIATIEPEWVEKAAKPFCTYSWTNARWQKKTGRVIADEQVSLKGLILLSGRIVNFGQIHKKNRPEARTIFIQKALVENQMSGSFSFLEKNRALIEKWHDSEHKLRRKNIVIDDTAIFTYYDSRLPQHVYDRSTLISFQQNNADVRLEMSAADVLLQPPDDKALLDFPSKLMHGDTEIPLSYCFEPGNAADGVTAHIPDYLVDHLKSERFDWLVPGLIVEKTTFLIKGLPKKIRIRLIPLQTTVERLLDSIEFGQGSYFIALSTALFNHFKITVHQGDWQDQLPDHLQMRFTIVDALGEEMMTGRNLKELMHTVQTVPAENKNVFLSKEHDKLVLELQKRLFKTWDFTGIPNRVECYGADHKMVGYRYAALSACPVEGAVRVIYEDSKKRAIDITLAGTTFLLQLVFKQPVKQITKYCRLALTGPSAVWMTSIIGGTEKASQNLLDYVMRCLFGSEFETIISREQYDTLVASVGQQEFYQRAKQIIDQILGILRQRRAVYELIQKYEHLSSKISLNLELFPDLYRHLESIVAEDFLATSRLDDFENLSRYLKSLAIRVERGYANPAKDRQKRSTLSRHLDNLEELRQKQSREECRELYQTCRFLVNELQVSIFSPEIRTVATVSEKKLRLHLQELRNCS